MGSGDIVIAVPLYRSPELIDDLFTSLIAMADEMKQLRAAILLINDSPDDHALASMLDVQLPRLRGVIEVELVMNRENLGFVRSANRAFAIALERRADIILLNSDARPRPGAFAEMTAVVRLDPMIGFVSPRSDNATLCNSPYPPAWRMGPPDENFARHKAIERFLPRYSYAPTAVGFCLYVRRAMIEEFGFFDEIYEGGYNEENDLIRRCNRRGYRAVLANHAYVNHLGAVSFSASARSADQREKRNRAILVERFPEFVLAVDRFYDGADHRAQKLLAGLVPLVPGKLRILFECRSLESSHKGTFEHSRRLLAALAPLASSRFDLFVLCERSAFEFHGLDNISGLRFCEQEDVYERPFAIAMRLVQPFLLQDILWLTEYAPITGVLVLDTIAMDCQQLDTHGLDAIWRFMVEAVSLIGYNSDFTRDQFKQRIAVPPHVTEFVSRCSTEILDYAEPGVEDMLDDHILVVGNDYPHKHVAETVERLRAAYPDKIIDILGASNAEERGIQPLGTLDDRQVDALYRRAGLVVFPSHYEGFGLPILHGLARCKPVIARDLPSAREIAQRVPDVANLYLAASTSDIVDLAGSGLKWIPSMTTAGDSSAESWTAAAVSLLDGFEAALRRFDFATCRRQQTAVLSHRARLDAEHRFHHSTACSEHMQTEIQSLSQRLAESDTQRAAARRAVAQASRQADQVRWETSQAIARTWKAERITKRNDQLLALLMGAPNYLIPTGTPRESAENLFGRLAKWSVGRSMSFNAAVRLPAPLPPTSKITSHMTLQLPSNDGHPADQMHLIFDAIDRLRVGGQLGLVVPRSPASERHARTLLHALGFQTTCVLTSRRHMRVMACKVWAARWPLAEPDDDALFLRAAYRSTLLREPDIEGAALYRAEIKRGMSRDAVIRSLLTSRERFDLIFSRLFSTDSDQR